MSRRTRMPDGRRVPNRRDQRPRWQRRWISASRLHEILKQLYPNADHVLLRPAWARYALDKRWMTPAAYDALEPTERVATKGSGRISALMYAESPLLRLFRKDTDFGGGDRG